MEIIELQKKGFGETIARAVEVLRAGGVVVHPTDTCYGLACDITNEEALEKLYEVKKMPRNKPVSVFVGSLEMAEEYVKMSSESKKIVERYWPGPLTCIIERNEKVPPFFNLNVESLGVRWPKNELCVGLVNGLGSPISTTSANLSGQKEVYKVEDFLDQLKADKALGKGGGEPDLVIDGGERPYVKPSTIIKFESEGGFQLIRQGDLKVT